MPKVLKPELDKSKPYSPYKIYQGLFLKKGHGLQSLFKIYSLAMIWLTLVFSLFASDAEFIGIIILREIVREDPNKISLIIFSRIVYGIGRALHQVSTFKLLSEICEPRGSEPGLMISFLLTSNSFKYAFEHVIILHEWANPEIMKTVLLSLGIIMIVSVIVYISIDIFHYISSKQLLYENTEQLKELEQISNGQQEFCLQSIRNTLKEWSLYGVYIFVILCMAILYYFGTISCPLLEGGDLWIDYTHTGNRDLESLRLSIHFIVMVTLPLCGSLLDKGSETASERKLKKQLEDLKNEGKTQPFHHDCYESSNVSTTRLMIYLCVGMICSGATAFFYIYERPYLIPMYDWVVNIVSCVYSVSSAMVLVSIFAIPKYIIARATKKEIERKAQILKKHFPKHTTKYLYFLHAVFYEQTEMSGLRYSAWISIIFLISDLSLNEKVNVENVDSILTVSAVLIVVLTLIVLFSFLTLSHLKNDEQQQESYSQSDENHSQNQQQNQEQPRRGEEISSEDPNRIPSSTNNEKPSFDASALFCQTPFLLKSKKSLLVSLFAWIIDLLMSVNLMFYVVCICGAPSIMLAIKETTLQTNRQSTHILIILFLPCLFIFFVFSFYYVYPDYFKRFILIHCFKWTRRFLGLSTSPPFTHIRESIHSSVTFKKNSLLLSHLKKQLEDDSMENPKEVLSNIKNIFPHTERSTTNNSGIGGQLQMEMGDDELYSTTAEYYNIEEQELSNDEYMILTVKDDRIQPLEDEDSQKRRMIIQKFSSRQEYVDYLSGEEFNEMFNERDYSFTSVTKGTVLFKKSKYRYSYTSEQSIRLLRASRPSATFSFYFITFYSILFMIPHIFSFFGFSTIPNIANPYTFLIISCNFAFGFFMFYPLYAIWLDTSNSMSCAFKEAIVQHDEILTIIKSKSFDTPHNSETQFKINLSKNQCLILEKDMLRKWYKKFSFLQKIVNAKMDLLRRNIVFAIVLSKGGSVILSLLSLFTNVEFNPQTFQPLYIFLGLDIILLYLVIDPSANLTFYMWRTILHTYRLISKIEGASEAYDQGENCKEIEKFKKNFHFVKYWNEMRQGSLCGCKLRMIGVLAIDIDTSLYKAWYYSLLTTLPPAIFKLIIQRMMAGRVAFRL